MWRHLSIFWEARFFSLLSCLSGYLPCCCCFPCCYCYSLSVVVVAVVVVVVAAAAVVVVVAVVVVAVVVIFHFFHAEHNMTICLDRGSNHKLLDTSGLVLALYPLSYSDFCYT